MTDGIICSGVDRAALLPQDKDYVYDFSQNPGRFADRKTFPALVGTGGSLAVGILPRKFTNSAILSYFM